MALMGRNGMGKTTSIRTLCSLLKPKTGSIRFEGEDILKLPIHKIAQLGIGLVPEGRRCFPNLTVEENLIAAATAGEWDINSVSKLFQGLLSVWVSMPIRFLVENSKCSQLGGR